MNSTRATKQKIFLGKTKKNIFLCNGPTTYPTNGLTNLYFCYISYYLRVSGRGYSLQCSYQRNAFI